MHASVSASFGLEKSRDRLGYGPWAGLVERIARPDVSDTSTQIVMKSLFYRAPDGFLRLTLSSQECGRGCRLRAANSFPMVVSDLGTGFCLVENFRKTLECKCNRTDSHCGAVAPTVVGLARA